MAKQMTLDETIKRRAEAECMHRIARLNGGAGPDSDELFYGGAPRNGSIDIISGYCVDEF